MKIISGYGPKRTRQIQIIAWVTAGMLTAMLVAQLFGYEDFAVTLGALMPFNDSPSLALTAATVVIAELLALPYLLGMYLSTLMRRLSGVFLAGISIFWMFTGFTNSHANNSGMFSTTVELPGGIFATLLALLLFVGAVLVIRADTQAVSSTPLEKK